LRYSYYGGELGEVGVEHLRVQRVATLAVVAPEEHARKPPYSCRATATAAIDDDNDVIYVSTNAWVEWRFATGNPSPGHSPRDTADVVKLNGTNGAELWRHTVPAPVLGGGLLLVNDVVFQVVVSGQLIGLSAGDGSELWRTNLGHDAATAPSFADDMIFVGGGLDYLYGGGPAGGHVRAFSL
jgi:outer membrane protein assembly factor BamB